ncbi:MAG: CcmD family protein [Coriobacteriia bacterium]|nr:CcmD family protein [Coriobacteriia bacterium]
MVDATNSLLYQLVLKDAPYVIAAYAVLWLALAGYVTVTLRRLMKLDKEVKLLEDAVAAKTEAQD